MSRVPAGTQRDVASYVGRQRDVAFRISAACVLLATAVPGLLFAPIFGLWRLVPPTAAVLVACFAVVELCVRFRSLRPWRPLLAFTVGLLALAETELRDSTLGGLPTAATVRALAAGVTESWQLTMQSTWPVRPDAELLLFVPMVVLLAAVLGIELLRWPALAVLPSLAALGLSQAFVAVSGPVATAVGLGYAVTAAGVFMASRWRPDAPRFAPARRAAAVGLVLPTVLLGVAAAVGVTAVDQGRHPAFSLRQSHFAPVPLPRTVSPLAEVAARLEHPDTPVFSYSTDGQVDRWRMVVLDGFNGAVWTPADRYRRLGAEIGPQSTVTVSTTAHSARLRVPPDGQWMPSQAMPAAVTGAAPYIDQASGMLLLPHRTGPVDYGLTWWEPDVDPERLAGAALDPGMGAGGDLGVIPPGIAELARTATAGLRPSFQSALVLERYLSENYRVATGSELPTGSGWPQLREFLLETKRGTSEQFAASYVALARIVGIPARLAVGYRAPRTASGATAVVHNRDVLAWPEVAVAGVGWVPLDPTGAATGSGAAPTRLAQVTAQVRADLPPPEELPDPPLPGPPTDPDPRDERVSLPVLPTLFGLLALVALMALGIPVVKVVRRVRRRRRTGVRGVVAAWCEARDLLRAHGIRVTPGMTVRDVAGTVARPSIIDGLLWLAGELDIALWSGAGANDSTVVEAWAAVKEIRRGLTGHPRTTRIRAVFDPRTLLAQ